ncbi:MULTISPECIES: cysteine peptidase family C39 domain-containing protein [Oscillatoriales]|uniref:cysteine peptidase family C39 domain-containing protein n=1 Tax=Planktothrix sp. FACHB-1355 TaxID=2692854 RepID=UPI001F551416|nr:MULTISPECIES: cysteine peptidase family C39 domain-containing protein [Oscillatoriales]
MVQNQSDLSISNELLEKTLGQSFLEKELAAVRQNIQVLEPQPLKQFWNSQNAEGGICIIIAGKVRLTHSQSDKPLSLKAGESFGELTLFPEESFEPYSAKATKDALTIYFLPSQYLANLSRKYPKIREHLHQQAVWRDSLLRGTDTPTANQKKSERETTFLDRQSPVQPKNQKKISKAYFPSPTLQVGHLWQRIIRRYPFFAQQSASDCGAASLVMVARYWGKRFSVNRLRDMANVDRNGASLRGLSAAAESIGFSTRPVKASLDQLAKQNLPAIAHWEGKHYVVVYEITRKHVIVADPAIGQRTLTHAQFKTDWTGYALLLQPTVFIRDAKEYSTPFWQFFELAKPHGIVLFEVFIASVFIQIFGLITPLFTQMILDNVVKHQSQLTLTTFGVGLLIFSLFRVAMTGLRQYLLDQTANRVFTATISPIFTAN